MRKTRKKVIELTPEWILMNLSDNWFTDGDGLAFISLFESNSSKAWIALALDTLDIEWEMHEVSIDQEIEFDYLFEIEDIKDLCPEFYEILVKDNIEAQSYYKKSDQKLE